MKTVLTKFLAISGVALLMLASCKKDETKVIAGSGKPGTLQASATTITLSKATIANTAVTFTWAATDYGYKAAVTNTIQIDVPGDNFATPKEFTIGANTLTQAFKVVDFNNWLLGFGLPPGVASQVQVRIKSFISTNTTPVYSNVLTLTATPFALVAYVYVPGAYQGWNPGSADSLQSATGNGVYTGVINFTPGNNIFKLTPVKNWNDSYGTFDNAATNTTIVYDGAKDNNLFAPIKSTVDPTVNITSNLIIADLNLNTIKYTPTLWSVVGDATPGSWPNGSGPQSDTDMKFNNGTQTWSVLVALKPGGLKFRLNHDWGTNYGSLTTAGVLDTQNNNNIPVTVSGNYLITVDIAHLTYTMVKQ